MLRSAKPATVEPTFQPLAGGNLVINPAAQTITVTGRIVSVTKSTALPQQI
jgi:hypothetical protein